MGWFWQDPASAKPSSPSQSTPRAPPQAPSQPAQGRNEGSSSGPDVDPEVRRFLEELIGATGSSGSERPPPPPTKQAPADPAPTGSPSTPAATATATAPQSSLAWSSWFSRSSTPADPTPAPDAPPHRAERRRAEEHASSSSSSSSSSPAEQPRLSPLAESLLPTTMDCEQAFNQAFYCQSLGGQWNNIYRHGAVRPCSENWDDFWFCMRVKGYSEGTVKDDMIREHYRKKHLSKYGSGKPNSEDVWKERKERLPPGTAFAEAAEAPTVSDAEYQRWEMERAERIRNGASS